MSSIFGCFSPLHTFLFPATITRRALRLSRAHFVVPMRERKFAMKDVTSDQPVFPRRKRRDAVENRERILNVARHLFATQGVDATSMNEIAQVAQVGPGTLYRCFAHKAELGQALLTEEIAAFWRQVDATLFPDAPALALPQLTVFLMPF